jgi:hypothetical protein
MVTSIFWWYENCGALNAVGVGVHVFVAPSHVFATGQSPSLRHATHAPDGTSHRSPGVHSESPRHATHFFAPPHAGRPNAPALQSLLVSQ